jgi:hypothetical protein
MQSFIARRHREKMIVYKPRTAVPPKSTLISEL